MAIQERNQKRYVKYIIMICLFLIAGICQYFDETPYDLVNIFLSNLANCLFFAIIITWYVSLKERIVERKIRRYLLIIANLLFALMILRYMKHKLFVEYDLILRLSWYAYYVPECLVPVFMFLCSLQIDRKKNDDINKRWYLFFIPSLIFIVFFLTNDLHQLCFSFKPNFGNYNSDYRRGNVFYLALTYNLLMNIAATVVLFHKCRVSTVKKKIWLPLSLFAVSIVFGTIALVFDFKSYKIAESLCLIAIVLVESLISIGFIPSNYNYKQYFLASNTKSLITDSNLQIYVSSYNDNLTKENLERILKEDAIVIDNLRYQNKKINGGYVFWTENLTTINYLNDEIQDIICQLVGENDLLSAKNALEEEKARIEEQHKIYDLIEKTTIEQTRKVKALVDDKSLPPETNLKLMCIYTAYIKRRSNLLIIHEKNNTAHIDELNFSIKESMTYLSLYGVSCSLISLKKDKVVDINIVELIYDFFEECIERALPSLNALIVKITETENKLNVRICLSGADKLIDKNWNKEIISKHNGQIMFKNEDEDYVILSLEESV